MSSLASLTHHRNLKLSLNLYICQPCSYHVVAIIRLGTLWPSAAGRCFVSSTGAHSASLAADGDSILTCRAFRRREGYWNLQPMRLSHSCASVRLRVVVIADRGFPFNQLILTGLGVDVECGDTVARDAEVFICRFDVVNESAR